MNTYPAGSLVMCRFGFTTRTLTATEQSTFLSGGGLPTGVGTDPPVVMFDYEAPEDVVKTLTSTSSPAVVKDEIGGYHVSLPVTKSGVWEWRGYGQDGGGLPVAATLPQSFRAQGL